MKKFGLFVVLILLLCTRGYAEGPAASNKPPQVCSLIILESTDEGAVNPVVAIVDQQPKTQQFLAELWKQNRPLFKDGEMNQFGPDGRFQEIDFNCGKETLVARSWHRLMEQDPNLVVTLGGVLNLEGKKREQILAKDLKWYRDFRKAFDDIFTQATGYKQ